MLILSSHCSCLYSGGGRRRAVPPLSINVAAKTVIISRQGRRGGCSTSITPVATTNSSSIATTALPTYYLGRVLVGFSPPVTNTTTGGIIRMNTSTVSSTVGFTRCTTITTMLSMGVNTAATCIPLTPSNTTTSAFVIATVDFDTVGRYWRRPTTTHLQIVDVCGVNVSAPILTKTTTAINLQKHFGCQYSPPYSLLHNIACLREGRSNARLFSQGEGEAASKILVKALEFPRVASVLHPLVGPNRARSERPERETVRSKRWRRVRRRDETSTASIHD